MRILSLSPMRRQPRPAWVPCQVDKCPDQEEKKEVKEAPKKEVKPVKEWQCENSIRSPSISAEAATQEERRSGAVSWQVYLAPAA